MSPELPGIYDAQVKALEICCIPGNKRGASRKGNGSNLRVKLADWSAVLRRSVESDP